MESEDDYENANDFSQNEYEEYLQEQKIQEEEQAKIQEEERNKQKESLHIQLSSEFKEFQSHLCNEAREKSKSEKELQQGGYFDFVFHWCKQWAFKNLENDPELRGSLIMEIETFILLFKDRTDTEDQALDPTISNIKNLKNELLKNTQKIRVDLLAPKVLAIDRILELLERAKQWQKETRSLAQPDISEKDAQSSLKEIQVSANNLFRYTKDDKLDQCANVMAELGKLRVSPYWEESIYLYRLMYKELMWIKQQLYSTFAQSQTEPLKSTETFEQVAQACDLKIINEALSKSNERVLTIGGVQDKIVNGGYFGRRINEIYRVIELQGSIDSEAPLYKGLCIILNTIRKLFNCNLQKKNFVWCIDQLHQLVYKKCEEYFVEIQEKKNQELEVAFEWLQKTNCLLDEIRVWRNDPQRNITKGDVQYETKNLNIEAAETKMFEIWFKIWYSKYALKELIKKDYQEIFRKLEIIIEDMMEECINEKSTGLLERALSIQEICEELIFKIQAEEGQIDWKTFRKRQFAKKTNRNEKASRYRR